MFKARLQLVGFHTKLGQNNPQAQRAAGLPSMLDLSRPVLNLEAAIAFPAKQAKHADTKPNTNSRKQPVGSRPAATLSPLCGEREGRGGSVITEVGRKRAGPCGPALNTDRRTPRPRLFTSLYCLNRKKFLSPENGKPRLRMVPETFVGVVLSAHDPVLRLARS